MASSGMQEEEFWPFSVRLYDVDVEAVLLGLQERDRIEVNLVLFCLYAASRGVLLDAERTGAMLALGRKWGGEIVRPLRQARRALKPLAGVRDAARLREEVKRLELAAEKIMHDELAALLAGAPRMAPADDASAVRAAGRRNLHAYLAALGLAVTRERAEALGFLLDRAFGAPPVSDGASPPE